LTTTGALSNSGSLLIDSLGGQGGGGSSLTVTGFSTALLEINGMVRSNIDSSHLLVRANLGGEGTILGSIYGGKLSPGPDGLPGRMTISRLGSFDEARAELIVDIAGTIPREQYDQLIVLEGLTHSYYDRYLGSLTVNVDFLPALGDRFLIIDNRSNGLNDGIFFDLPEGAIFQANGISLQISYAGGDGNDVTLTAVPEPSSIWILLAVPMTLVRRRRF